MAAIIPLEQKKLPADCYVFKHSTRCPISAAAADEVRAVSWDLPLYWVNVVEQRDLSNWVATTLHVKHETPQLIRVESGKPARVWSHHEIRRPAIGQSA